MSFRCPACGAVSHNPNDEREGYCARCHDFVHGVRRGFDGRPMFWILDDERNPVPASLEEWGRMYAEPGARIVEKTEFHVAGRAEPVEVSTVFLGIDHGFGMPDAPVLFESMIFGGPRDEEQRRYCTWSEAEAGHKQLVAELMARYVVAIEGE